MSDLIQLGSLAQIACNAPYATSCTCLLRVRQQQFARRRGGCSEPELGQVAGLSSTAFQVAGCQHTLQSRHGFSVSRSTMQQHEHVDHHSELKVIDPPDLLEPDQSPGEPPEGFFTRSPGMAAEHGAPTTRHRSRPRTLAPAHVQSFILQHSNTRGEVMNASSYRNLRFWLVL